MVGVKVVETEFEIKSFSVEKKLGGKSLNFDCILKNTILPQFKSLKSL